MREFEVAPGGYTPRHSHDFEHEVFVLAGDGVVFEGDQEHKLTTGDVVFVQPNEVASVSEHGDATDAVFVLDPNSCGGQICESRS